MDIDNAIQKIKSKELHYLDVAAIIVRVFD